MTIIGVDYHPSFQEIAFVDTQTGEYGERHLDHSSGEAQRFYRDLKQKGVNVRVGMEATGHARWFERLTAECGARDGTTSKFCSSVRTRGSSNSDMG